MQNSLSRFIAAIFIVLFAPLAAAQSMSSFLTGSQQSFYYNKDTECPPIEDPNTMINGYSGGGLCFLYEKMYGLENTSSGAMNTISNSNQSSLNAQPATQNTINNTLNNTQKNAPKNLSAGVKNIPTPTITPAPVGTSPSTKTTTAAPVNSPDPGLASLDVHSLLGKRQYKQPVAQQPAYQTVFGVRIPVASAPAQNQTDEQQLADNFISVLSSPGLTPLGLSFIFNDNTPYNQEQIAQILDDAVVAKYLAELRAYTAQLGTGIAFLNRFKAERTIQPNLAKNAGIVQPTPGSPLGQAYPDITASWPNASPLAVKQYQATNRLNDPGWYVMLQTSSPAQLQRQTLLVLTEMRAEMFEQTEEIKRLNATLAVIAIQNANAQTVLMANDFKAAQDKILNNTKD